MNETPAPVPNLKTELMGYPPTQPSVPLVQHQYKLFPSPDSPVQLRQEVEEHRYEAVEDSPPRYSTLEHSSNLLSFEESPEKPNEKDSHRYCNLEEFDPLATNEDLQTYQSKTTGFD